MPKNHISLVSWSMALLLLLSPPQALAGGEDSIILISGPETTDFLERIGKPLLQAAGITPESVHFHVMLDPALNAVALQSQDILFNSGLVLQAQNRDELAGVMAHEIAHLQAGHHIKLQEEMASLSLRTMLISIVGVATSLATGSSQAAQAAMVGGGAAGQASLLASQRQKETQADRLAIHFMAQAGYDPWGLARFMEKIQREQRGHGQPPPYLLSHPLSSTRLTEIRQMARERRPTTHLLPTQDDNESLKRVQAILLAKGALTPGPIVHHFRAKLEKKPEDFVARYGLAVALRYAGELPESDRQLSLLIQRRPDDPYLYRERGRTHTDWGHPVQAEENYRKALTYRPKNPDLLYWLADSLKEQKRYHDAGRILRRLTTQYPTRAAYFYLLGMVEGRGGKAAAGHLAMGRYYGLRMEFDTALWHLQESIRLSRPDSVERGIAQREKDRLQALAETIAKAQAKKQGFP